MSQSVNTMYSGDTLYIRDNWSSERIEHMRVVALTVMSEGSRKLSKCQPRTPSWRQSKSALLIGKGTVFQSIILRFIVMD